MAYFALLWKARTVEKYRLHYENEKVNSIMNAGVNLPRKTLFQRWSHYRYDAQKRLSRTFHQWYSKGSHSSNFLTHLRTDQAYLIFFLKSMFGFFGGLILTYLCFLFFIFQLSISLYHATIMSTIIGIVLTLGLAFSYRIRCLVFLLVPQFFSRVGRYTLTCYALVLILTGPATNTLKNSEVLSESMACSQEQIKTSVSQLNESMRKPYSSVKDCIKLMMDKMKKISTQMIQTLIKINRLVLSIVGVMKSTFSWLKSIALNCHNKLGTPYQHCVHGLAAGVQECRHIYGYNFSWLCNVDYVAKAACVAVKPLPTFCGIAENVDESICATIKKRLRNFSDRIRTMLYVELHVHHSYSFLSNTSSGGSQLAAGIVTEIRNKADPIFTWLSWSSCITSLSLLLIIFRAKHYQHMYETRSRFDNRYVTKELRELDLKRLREGRETILPLNRRERAKYITTTSFRLLASEKVYLNRSVVFMVITTFKLLIHMVADYSLYWVLMTIRYHGRSQTPLQALSSQCLIAHRNTTLTLGLQLLWSIYANLLCERLSIGAEISQNEVIKSGSGFVARFIRSIINTLHIPLSSSLPSSISCLPNPYPPDFRRYTQIGVLIFLLWFFALLEPYGLRLRNVIMGHYRPERSKARAVWLYNHILRTRGSFMKFARRKLHKEYKYTSESKYTFRNWLDVNLGFQCIRSILGTAPEAPHCLLCGTIEFPSTIDTELIRCNSKDCSGIYCYRCFSDIGQLCTICLSPTDYGDLSDVSLERGSDDENSQSDDDPDDYPEANEEPNVTDSAAYDEELDSNDDDKHPSQSKSKRNWNLFTREITDRENIPLLPYATHQLNMRAAITNAQKVSKNNNIQFSKGIDAVSHYNSTYSKNINPEIFLHPISNKIIAIKNNQRFTDTNYNKSNNITTKYSFIYKTNEHRPSRVRNYILREDQNKIKESLIKHSILIFTYDKNITDRQLQSFVHYSMLIYPITYLPQSNFYDIKKVRNSLSITKLHEQTELAETLRRNCKQIIRRRKKFQEKEGNVKIKMNMKSDILSMRRCSDYLRNSIRNLTNRKKIPNKNNKKTSLDGDEKNKKKRGKQRDANIDETKHIKGKNKLIDKNKGNNSYYNSHGKFHTICSKYWNNVKFNLIPRIDLIKCDERKMLSKETKNYKHRKKRTDSEIPIEIMKKKDIEEARKFRVTTYFADQDWFKRKYESKVFPIKQKELVDYSICDVLDNNKNQAFSHNVTKFNSVMSMVKFNTRSISFRCNIPMKENNIRIQRSCHCLDSKNISPNITIKTKPKRTNVTIKALERFRKKIKKKPSSPSPSEFIDRIVDAVDVAREKKLENGCSHSNTSVSRRINYCRSLGIHEFDNFTNENQGISDIALSGQTKEPCCKQNVTDSGDNRKKLMHIKRLKNRFSIMREFCSSLFGASTKDNKSCKGNIKETEIPKNTASIGVNVLPAMKSFACQQIETKLLRDHITQVGTYVIETGEAILEKYSREAAADTTHQTCTCATQRTITNRDVGTWLDQQRCGHHMHYHHDYKEHDEFKQDLQQNETQKTSNNKTIEISSSSLDSLSFTSISSIKSEGTKTDTTICSLATVNYNERKLRSNRNNVKVVTKANQSTLTDRAKLCDVSTVTDDWWSPLIERKDKEISLEKKQGGYTMRNEKIGKRLRNRGMVTEAKIVTFRSRAQIIPIGAADIMSPSRYLLESQKYYNELFSPKFYAPHVFPVTKFKKYQDKNRSPMSSRHRNRRGHKTKRLEEGHSPRKERSQRRQKQV